ncbi:MAG: glycosyltransferase family 4 protein [Candidatus Altiarchaeota archaeon]|nr:glycosyltransferase family 4 protein [Candidatus Altiarchaeota archaeon]
MKVCLYLELESKLNISGITSSIKNQRKALQLNKVTHTSDLKEDFDIIHLNTIGLKSIHTARKASKQGKKVVIHAHTTADDFRDSYRFSNHLAPLLQKYLTYYYNQADLVLCPTEYTKKILEKYKVNTEIKTISNGIDLEKFTAAPDKRNQFRDKHNLTETTPLMVGHVFIRKGLESFINTAREINNRFIWIGKRYRSLEDPRIKELLKKAPENILFIEYIEDLVSAYSSCDIFFFPSHCENQGIAILEASACEKPILVRDIPAYNGWLKDEYNCLKAKNDEEFNIQLKRLIDDEWLRERLGRNALKQSREHSLQKIGAQLKANYEYLMKK